MGKYTTEVRYICETSVSEPVDGNGFNTVNEIIEKSRENIFNFDYPIFDEEYRPVLETKILRHYYTREICEETVGLWKLRLCDKLNMIMPYYNQMYESTLLTFNPFYDVDYTRSGDKSEQGTSLNNEMSSNIETSNKDRDITKQSQKTDINVNKGSTTKNDTSEESTDYSSSNRETKASHNENSYSGWDLYSDTPQGSVSNINLTGNSYLTNARRITSSGETDETGSNTVTSSGEGGKETSSTSNTAKYENNVNKENTNAVDNESITTDVSQNRRGIKKGSINNLSDYSEHVVGKMPGASYSKLLTEFRNTFLNIDEMIIEELSTLFFGLWE